jgi:hypothetical protein
MKKMAAGACLLAAAGSLFVWAGQAPGATPEPDPRRTVLDTGSYWRFRTVRETPEVVDRSGKIVHGRVVWDFDNVTRVYSWFKAHPEPPSLPEETWRVKSTPPDKVLTLPADTPANWMKPEFDDGAWFRSPGPMFGNFFSRNEGWKLILMRGRFEVKDPDAAGDLALTMAYRGGVVIYLNGEEVARAHMPKGPVTLAAPAEPYPASADFTADGWTLPWGRQTTRRDLSRKPQEIKDRVASRIRRMKDAVIPGAKLRKGTNVLAIAIHRAPTPAIRYVTRHKGAYSVNSDLWWTRLGLHSIRLAAYPVPAVVPNTGPQADQGFRIWNHSIVQKVSTSDYPDPFDLPSPVHISATRNGSFSGQIVLSDKDTLRGIKVTVSDLKGPDTIPASAVLVRYARPDGSNHTFDSLEESPPPLVPLFKPHQRAVQPVWFTVRVPAEAPPGEYRGTVTIRTDDVDPVQVGLRLHVSNWLMPPPKAFNACMDIIQSPESVALAYDVPLWSDKHLKLLDKTFSLLGATACKTLYVTCIRRTHFGNEHAMVRWTRNEEGELQPDFTVVEKYLDAAMKHLGKIPRVILYCWEPPTSQGHAGGTGKAARTHDKPILFSLYDWETGEYSAARGPAWGTPEARRFWKKLTDGIQKVLAKRGLENAMLFGLIGDHRPTKQAMDDISNGVPDAKWAVHSHLRCEEWKGYKMGMFVALWGIGVGPTDPSRGYSFGWTNPKWMLYYPREMSLSSTLTEYRCKLETWIGARSRRGTGTLVGVGPKGVGRLGADFWVVVKDGRGRARWTLAGRYPEAAWGQLNLNFGVPRILAIGKEGPIATVRSEAFREAVQEVEARIYLERALLDPAAPRIVGAKMLRRCRTLLDERIRIVNVSAAGRSRRNAEAWFISSGWRDRAEALFDLAAQVAAAYGDKTPSPDIGRTKKKEGQ